MFLFNKKKIFKYSNISLLLNISIIKYINFKNCLIKSLYNKVIENNKILQYIHYIHLSIFIFIFIDIFYPFPIFFIKI